MITRMAILNRLQTKSILLSFDMQLNGNCGLCGATLEDRDHLFFGCRFFRNVCGSVLQLCGWVDGIGVFSIGLLLSFDGQYIC
ncbi:hypothetical protein GQ457_06G027250 [Hibiscus cannabinus]